MCQTNDNSAQEQRIEALLARLQSGDKTAMDELLPLLFDDLRRLARAQRSRVGGGETLRTTALIHEAYLKLRRSRSLSPDSRRHFLHTAALAMRHILIDHARSQLAAQDRHEQIHAGNEDSLGAVQRQARLVLDIDTALAELQQTEPRLVNIVNYRYFAGYNEAETADLLDVSPRTVRRDWARAKTWLSDKLDAHAV